MRRYSCVGLAILLCTVGLAGGRACPAFAEELPAAVDSHLDEIEALLEHDGLPPGRAPVACGGLCEDMAAAERAASGGHIGRREVLAELERLSERVGLRPPLRLMPGVNLGSPSAVEVGDDLRRVSVSYSDLPAPAGPITLLTLEEKGEVVSSRGSGPNVQNVIRTPATGGIGTNSAGYVQ